MDTPEKQFIDIKEYRKNYYQNNKDHIKQLNLEKYHSNKDLRTEQVKEYYSRNRDNILEKKNTKCLCECGGRFTNTNKSMHFKSKKHIAYLEQQ